MQDSPTYETEEQKFIDENNLKIGDKVKVTRKATYNEKGWDNTWVPDMTPNIGEVGIIRDFGNGSHGMEISFTGFDDEILFSFPFFVLEKV